MDFHAGSGTIPGGVLPSNFLAPPRYDFFLGEELGQLIQYFPAAGQDTFYSLMGLFHDPADLFINLACFRFAVSLAPIVSFRKEHRLARPFIGHQAQAITHAVFGDHGPGNIRSTLQVVLRPRGDFSENQLFGDPARLKGRPTGPGARGGSSGSDPR